MWNYTKPKPYTVESSVAPNDSNDYITPVYDELESNIPKTLMQYSDHPFPAGTQPLPALDTVLEYLQRYGTELLPLIAFETAVQKVQQLPNRQWALDLKYLTTNNIAREVFDAILVASSHFDKPKMPRIAGLVDWQRTYPGTVSHSLTYRNASAYNGQVTRTQH